MQKVDRRAQLLGLRRSLNARDGLKKWVNGNGQRKIEDLNMLNFKTNRVSLIELLMVIVSVLAAVFLCYEVRWLVSDGYYAVAAIFAGGAALNLVNSVALLNRDRRVIEA